MDIKRDQFSVRGHKQSALGKHEITYGWKDLHYPHHEVQVVSPIKLSGQPWIKVGKIDITW